MILSLLFVDILGDNSDFLLLLGQSRRPGCFLAVFITIILISHLILLLIDHFLGQLVRHIGSGHVRRQVLDRCDGQHGRPSWTATLTGLLFLIWLRLLLSSSACTTDQGGLPPQLLIFHGL